mgnify:CR=1 FL=1
MNKFKWLFTPGFAAGLVFSLMLPSASADTSVWRVSNGEATLYLAGTVHLLRESDYPLPPEYDQAYREADALVFEVDLDAMEDLSIQARLLAEMTYNDGRTLREVLNQEAYQALEAYASEVGMPMALMQTFKPGMIVATMQIFEFQKMGFTPEGVDAHFNVRANEDGKPVLGLETLEEQIAFLASMGEGNESEFMLSSLRDLEGIEESMEGMISAWRSGDTELLESMFVTEMREQAPQVYETLLRSRNLNWVPPLIEMLGDEDIEFVLVGAAHLVGEDGLLTLLGQEGYVIEQL